MKAQCNDVADILLILFFGLGLPLLILSAGRFMP